MYLISIAGVKIKIFKWKGDSLPSFVNGGDHRQLAAREGRKSI